MRNILIAAASALLLAGCSGTWSSSDVKTAPGVTAPETKDASELTGKEEKQLKASAGKILLSEKDVTDRKYKTLAELEVTVNKTTIFHADPTREMVRAKLKEEAAKLNADAVILVRYGTVGIGVWSWGSLEGRGQIGRAHV